MFSAYGYTAGPGFARYCAIVWGMILALVGFGMLSFSEEQYAVKFLRLSGLTVLAVSLFFLYLGIWRIPREEKEFNQLAEAEKVKRVEKSLKHIQVCFSIQRIILGVALMVVLVVLIDGLYKTIFP